jgi:hypothetical protein
MEKQKSKTPVKKMSSRAKLKELYRLSDRIRFEILGETDAEYRTECEKLQKLVKAEIEVVKDRIEKNLP